MAMYRIKCILLFVFLIPAFLFAKESNLSSSPLKEESANLESTELLFSESKRKFTDSKTKVTFKASVPQALVYLNGQLEGNTPLTISDLPPGRYNLRIEKKGYEPKRCRIEIRAGQEEAYYIELKKIEGWLTIESNPSDATILIDHETVSKKTIPLSEGEHTVTASRFGYKNKSSSVYIFKYTNQILSIELEKADFTLSDLKPNKNSFNPLLPGSVGQVKFNFSVTDNKPVNAEIKDSENQTVLSFKLPEFKTWEQSLMWDGKDSSGATVKDGTYTLELTGENQTVITGFSVNSAIKLPLAVITPAGSGIGSLPMAFSYPKATTAVSVKAGVCLQSADELFYGAPVSAAVNYAFTDSLEISAGGGILAGHNGAAPYGNAALKYVISNSITPATALNAGFLIRAGANSKDPWAPYGAVTENGAGGGLVIGADSKNWFFGASSEYIFGASSFNGEKTDQVFRNGLAFQAKTGSIAAAVYGAINSSLGTTMLPEDNRPKNHKAFLRALEAGFELLIQPSFSTLFIDIKGSGLHFDNKTYYRTEAGFLILL